MEVMIVNKITNNYLKNNSITALIGELGDLPVIINNVEEIKINSKRKVKHFIKKDLDFLESLKLDDSIFNQKLKDLSSTELKFIMLIKATQINPELIVLTNFEKGISSKNYNLIWHLIKKITIIKNIKFLIISRDIKFVNKITKKVIIINNKIIKYQGDLLLAFKQDMLPKPEIIDFIDKANNKGANLSYTLDYKELLKDIYRGIS